jgi:hypothetical protein
MFVSPELGPRPSWKPTHLQVIAALETRGGSLARTRRSSSRTSGHFGFAYRWRTGFGNSRCSIWASTASSGAVTSSSCGFATSAMAIKSPREPSARSRSHKGPCSSRSHGRRSMQFRSRSSRLVCDPGTCCSRALSANLHISARGSTPGSWKAGCLGTGTGSNCLRNALDPANQGDADLQTNEEPQGGAAIARAHQAQNHRAAIWASRSMTRSRWQSKLKSEQGAG